MSAIEDLCARWDHYSKGESPTTKAIRAAVAQDRDLELADLDVADEH